MARCFVAMRASRGSCSCIPEYCTQSTECLRIWPRSSKWNSAQVGEQRSGGFRAGKRSRMGCRQHIVCPQHCIGLKNTACTQPTASGSTSRSQQASSNKAHPTLRRGSCESRLPGRTARPAGAARHVPTSAHKSLPALAPTCAAAPPEGGRWRGGREQGSVGVQPGGVGIKKIQVVARKLRLHPHPSAAHPCQPRTSTPIRQPTPPSHPNQHVELIRPPTHLGLGKEQGAVET